MRVGTDEADAVAVVDGEGEVVEEWIGAEAFGDVLRDQDRRHVSSLWGVFRGRSPVRVQRQPRAGATIVRMASMTCAL
jgi:hypothetical protein